MAGGIREGLEALEQVAQCELDLCSKRLAMLPQDVGLVFIKPGKTLALQQAACLSLPRLIWRCFLPHAFPRSGISSLETLWFSEESCRKSNSCCMSAGLGRRTMGPFINGCSKGALPKRAVLQDAKWRRLQCQLATAISRFVPKRYPVKVHTGSEPVRWYGVMPCGEVDFPTPTCTTMFMVNSLLEG